MPIYENELIPTSTVAEIAAVGKALNVPKKPIRQLCRVAKKFVLRYGYEVCATQVAEGEFCIYTTGDEIIAVKYA